MPLTAEQILATPTLRAADIFSGDLAEIRRRFHDLATVWHPDVCRDPDASAVFSKLVMLRDAATRESMGSASQATYHPAMDFETADGRRLRLRPLALRETDFGQMMVAAHGISLILNADMVRCEIDAINGFRFADSKMRKQMSPYLPSPPKLTVLSSNEGLLTWTRAPEEILLSHLIDHLGEIPEKHVAWIGSGLLNIACWLQWAGLVHGAIGPDTILINPTTHSVRLFAGWSLATAKNTRPTMISERTLRIVPRLTLSDETVNSLVDAELIRQTLREALGDPSGTKIHRSTLPTPLRQWITLPAKNNAVDDYKAWQGALERAWGTRRFVVFETTAHEVYF